MASAADRLKEYEKLFQQSQSYDTSKFQSDFEKAYNEATNYNKDLIDQKAQAIGQAQALPNQLREQYYSSPIRNPLAQEALISTRRGNITSDITGLTDLLQARGARYQDVLRKYLAAYENEASRARTAAENMWRQYQDQVQQDQFNRQLYKGSGSSDSTVSKLLKLLSGGDGDSDNPTNARQIKVQQLKAAIQNVRNVRDRMNDEQFNAAFRNILDTAAKNGLKISEQALWQQLGNDVGVPQTLRLILN